MSVYLIAPELGRVDLECEPDGYNVKQLQIGAPGARPVVRNRALADGVNDRTLYVGARAVTVSIELDHRRFAIQDLIDRVTPFMSPRYRPRLVWRVERETPERPDPLGLRRRSLVVRGVDYPIVIAGPRFPILALSWVSAGASSVIESRDETCQTVRPTGDGEAGRTYDLLFDRVYPASLPTGTSTLTNLGNAPVDWHAQIASEVTDPRITINGIIVQWTGLTLLPGQTVEIDTVSRTMLRNGDPTDSVYNLSNFASWDWDDLRLRKGDNTVRFQGDDLLGDPRVTFCWRHGWH